MLLLPPELEVVVAEAPPEVTALPVKVALKYLVVAPPKLGAVPLVRVTEPEAVTLCVCPPGAAELDELTLTPVNALAIPSDVTPVTAATAEPELPPVVPEYDLDKSLVVAIVPLLPGCAKS